MNDVEERDEVGHGSHDTAPGGRNPAAVAKSAPATDTVGEVSDAVPDYIPKGFSKKDIENMGGSLKVHIRLALTVDIRVTAEVKGDICIGIL